MQRFQRETRIEMPLAREIEPGAEATRKIGLQSGDLALIHPAITAGPRCETRELCPVAWWRDDQRAIANHKAGSCLVPPVKRHLAKRQDRFLRIFALTPGRQHAAGIKRRSTRRLATALRNLDNNAPPRQFGGRRQTGDPRSLDKDMHFIRHSQASEAACKAHRPP